MMNILSTTAAVAVLLSVVAAVPAATPAPTCTITVAGPPFRTAIYASTVTKTSFTDCGGCAITTRNLGPGPVITKHTTATLTTTVTKCAASGAAEARADCPFRTIIPLTVSVPTCYGHYVTATKGINCNGCSTYTNIGGIGPVRTCGTTKPAATGTSTVLSCTS